MTKYTVSGIGEVDLGQKDFVAKGGEGSVFIKGKTAYKIYENASNMLPYGKMQELSVLNKDNIIKPQQVILNKNNDPCGYTMKTVEGQALCQIFTKAFKDRNNIDTEHVIRLIKEIQSIVKHIHEKNILVVDLNEFNFLISNDFQNVFAIDVNSYQTPSYPATVIMPSVLDRHCKNKFTKETDWFSWGIVTFQMLMGIHPYKGNHPDFSGLALDKKLDARMIKNISVFNDKATYPKICPSFDIIPTALRKWYKAVFEEGKRIAPPNDFTVETVEILVTQLAGSNFFNIKEIAQYTKDVTSFYCFQGNALVLTSNVLRYDGKKYNLPTNDPKFIFCQKNMRPYAVYLENNLVKLIDVSKHAQIQVNLAANAVFQYEDRVYAQSGKNIVELSILEINGSTICKTKEVGQILDTPVNKVFDGVVIQNLLGRHYVSVFPKSGTCYQLAIQELDEYNVQEAKFENNVLVIIAANRKTNHYDRFVLKFGTNYNDYDLRKVENISYSGINFTVNDAGICILINEDEKIEIFSNNKNNTAVKEIDDPAISNDMRLCHDGTKIMFYRNNKIYSFSMR